ncbi:hypothetical protein FHU41_000788 [Psychromicrobium silvestre]|uniref:Uncharacterized protein n=1 Tax=Psychromicrobium silvestre TaxID=1645614 RepID=A0A7Y9S7D3_9MICC|nr:hypothetical protein [Psychromicrobium silvestre]NYE94567.1 hypothetical protein [Psychromicrobium silvestre]
MTTIPFGTAKALHPRSAKLPDLSDPRVIAEIYAQAEKSAKVSRRRRLGIFRSTKPVRG